jgi:hypothetical protein
MVTLLSGRPLSSNPVETKIETLPNWVFSIEEISNGVYKLKGRNDLGCGIELTGCDPELLITRAEASAEQMERDLHGRRDADDH